MNNERSKQTGEAGLPNNPLVRRDGVAGPENPARSGDDDSICQNHGCSCAALPPHVCPFKDEINDDTETLCTCCEDCQYECRMDI